MERVAQVLQVVPSSVQLCSLLGYSLRFRLEGRRRRHLGLELRLVSGNDEVKSSQVKEVWKVRRP